METSRNQVGVRPARRVRLIEHGGVVVAYPEPHRTPVLPPGWAPLSRDQQEAGTAGLRCRASVPDLQARVALGTRLRVSGVSARDRAVGRLVRHLQVRGVPTRCKHIEASGHPSAFRATGSCWASPGSRSRRCESPRTSSTGTSKPTVSPGGWASTTRTSNRRRACLTRSFAEGGSHGLRLHYSWLPPLGGSSRAASPATHSSGSSGASSRM